jgi:prophage regulatory protein
LPEDAIRSQKHLHGGIMANIKILRRNEVESICGLSCTTIYRLMGKGEFPRQIKISPRSVGWLESDILDYLQKRVESSQSAA